MSKWITFIERFGDAGVVQQFLATLVISMGAQVLRPIAHWGREILIVYGVPRVCAWICVMLIYALGVWLFLFLCREGTQYPLIKMDAICYGFLLGVCAGLSEPGAEKALADIGLATAARFAAVPVAFLILHSAARRDRNDKRQTAPRAYPTYGLSLK
jgi:hypothetical protein